MPKRSPQDDAERLAIIQVREMTDRQKIATAAKRLSTDLLNGNLSTIGTALDQIGGASSRLVIADMFYASGPVSENQKLREVLRVAAADSKTTKAQREAIFDLAVLHLVEQQP